MCGIVGYIGKRDAYPVLVKGLKRLEYRGYDSAGIALINHQNQLNVYKTKGRVSDLEHFVEDKDISGNIGIAHTRWANLPKSMPILITLLRAIWLLSITVLSKTMPR